MRDRDSMALIGWATLLAVVLFLPSLVFAGMVALDLCHYEPGCNVNHTQMVQVVWLSLILLGEMVFHHREQKLRKV